MKNELISIVVPVYNVEKYLTRCIESLINQTCNNLEIILVDDGSTDKSGKICDNYSKKDKRIKVIHKKNGGLSDARNTGIDIASGKYIGFIDSDDWILPNMYLKLYNLLIDNSAEISVCNFIQTSRENMKYNIKHEKIKILNREEAIKKLSIDKEIMDYAWNKLYKTELFKNIRYPVGKNMEDKGTTYKLFLKANKIVYTNNIYYMYFYRKDSIVNQVNYKLIYDDITLSVKRYNELKEIYPKMKILDKRLFQLLIRCYYTAIKKSDKKIIKLFEDNKYLSAIKNKHFVLDLKTIIKIVIIKMKGYKLK